MIYLLTAVR